MVDVIDLTHATIPQVTKLTAVFLQLDSSGF